MGAAAEVITERTLLVSIQAANNEIETLQDIPGLSLLAHRGSGLSLRCSPGRRKDSH